MTFSFARRLAAAVLALVLAIGLCACGDAEPTVTTTTGAATTTLADDVTTTVADVETTTVSDGETTTVADNKTTTVADKATTTVGKDTTTQNQPTTAPQQGQTTKTTTTTKNVTTTTTADDSTAIKARSYQLVDIQDQITIWGRTAETKKSLFFDHTAAGIEFTAYVEGEVKLSIGQSTATSGMVSYYTVWIDGVRQEGRLKSDSRSPKKLTIAKFDKGGVHTIRVLKQTELQGSQSIFKELSFTGYLMKPAEKRDLLIEFLGDSITSGYGNLMYVEGVGDPNGRPASAINSDGTQAYAFLTAEKLNARCTILSDSGIGVIYDQNTNGDRTMANYWKYKSYGRKDLGLYTPTEVPNVVVINLGTNDEWNKISDSKMTEGCKTLINQIRTTYKKDVPIVWAIGMMYSAKNSAVKKAITELGGEAAGLYFTDKMHPNGDGGGGHPSIEASKKNADFLVDFLKSKNLV